jgi:hypothetical protein
MLPELLHGEERKVWGDGGYPKDVQANGRIPTAGIDNHSSPTQVLSSCLLPLPDTSEDVRRQIAVKVNAEEAVTVTYRLGERS